MSLICTRCDGVETNQKYLDIIKAYPTSEPFICSKCFEADMDAEMEATFNNGKWMEHTHKGHEVWTYHTDLTKVIGVDGSVCVGISGERKIWYNGKEYTISIEQADDLWKDIEYQEYGTNDIEAIARIEGVDKI